MKTTLTYIHLYKNKNNNNNDDNHHGIRYEADGIKSSESYFSTECFYSILWPNIS